MTAHVAVEEVILGAAPAMYAVEAAGGRIVQQSPHVLVHPGDAAGVVIQLTPRVQH